MGYCFVTHSFVDCLRTDDWITDDWITDDWITDKLNNRKWGFKIEIEINYTNANLVEL